MHRALTPSHVLLLLLAIPFIEGAGQGYALSLRFPPVHCEIGETPAKWFLAVIPTLPLLPSLPVCLEITMPGKLSNTEPRKVKE